MTVLPLLLTLAIVALVGAAVWLLRLSKAGNKKAGRAAGLCAAAAVVLSVVRMVSEPDPAALDTEAMLANDASYQSACGEVLAASLVSRHPGARVVLLTDPNARDRGTQALLDSLERFLRQGGLTVSRKAVEVPEEVKARIAASDPLEMSPETRVDYESMMLADTAMWYDAGVLSGLLLGLKDQADVVISTPVLGQFLEPVSLPRKGKAPALVLLNADLPDPEPLLKRSVLDTLVSYRSDFSGWQLGDEVPDDPEAAFGQRYVLETASP